MKEHGIPTEGEGSVDLLIEIACKKVNNIFL
jgi:hypothetical protein